VERLEGGGYYGGVRLLLAICKIFHNHCKHNSIALDEKNFTLSYDTNIPRQVPTLSSLRFLKTHVFVMLSWL
jgi:glucuronokinase